MSEHRHLTVIDGFRDGFPIALGYFPIAMAFGLLSRETGLGLLETLAFSFIVFAGAAQFIAVSMIAAGIGGLEIVIATLFLNFRHFLMSASLSAKMHIEHQWMRPLISFFVTDESFSVASFAEGKLTSNYMIPMALTAYFGWGIGTGVGFIAGSILQSLLQKAMGIGLYVMFVALLAPEIEKSSKVVVLSLAAGIGNAGLRFIIGVPQGWSIILSIIIVAIIGVLIYDREAAVEVIDGE